MSTRSEITYLKRRVALLEATVDAMATMFLKCKVKREEVSA